MSTRCLVHTPGRVSHRSKRALVQGVGCRLFLGAEKRSIWALGHRVSGHIWMGTRGYSALQQMTQFSSVTQSCPILCDPMNPSMPGLPVHHQLLECTQTHIHWVSDAIPPSHPLSSSVICHPLSSPSPPAPNPSQHQSLFQWVNSSHEVAKVLEFQL